MSEQAHSKEGRAAVTAMSPVFVEYATQHGLQTAIDAFRAGGFREYQLIAFVEASLAIPKDSPCMVAHVATTCEPLNGWGQTLDDEVARDREEEHMQTNREGRLD